MMKGLRSFAGDESGATAVEYGALVGFIAIAVMLVVESIGLSVKGTLLEIKAAFAGGASSAAQN